MIARIQSRKLLYPLRHEHDWSETMEDHDDRKTFCCERDVRYMSKKYRCSLRTLRFYEERGFLAPARVNHQRFYSVRDEIKLRLIHHGKRLGLSLNAIGELIASKIGKDVTERHRSDSAILLLSRESIVDQIVLLTKQRDKIAAAIEDARSARRNSSTFPADDVGTSGTRGSLR